VETVLGHRFKTRQDGTLGDKSSELEFHIRWKGFSSRWDSWEPFKNVRLNETVIDYLRANKLKRFIPRNLEGDQIQDEEEAVQVSIVNRIRSQENYTYPTREKQQKQFKRLRFSRFSFPPGDENFQKDEENLSISNRSEKHWVYNKHTRSWVDSEEIRHLGPY
jgi:hypothetical protein